MAEMSMILKDIRFRVREATIYGFVADSRGEPPGLSWFVEVLTEERVLKSGAADDPDAGEIYADPRMSCEFKIFPMRSWAELEGKTVDSDDAERIGSIRLPSAISYFETHESMPSSLLKFVKRAGNKFQIHWEGRCHPLLGEPYQRDVPFLIEAEAVFKELGVHVGPRDTDETALARLSRHLDPAGFIQRPIKETSRRIPVENRFGLFDSLLRRIFPGSGTRRHISRQSIFEPRV